MGAVESVFDAGRGDDVVVSSRRWGVGVAVAVVVLAALAAAGWLLVQPRDGPRVEHDYPSGGFALTLPSSWNVDTIDSAERPWNWVEAERRSRLGPSDAWLWVNRTRPGRRNHLDTI